MLINNSKLPREHPPDVDGLMKVGGVRHVAPMHLAKSVAICWKKANASLIDPTRLLNGSNVQDFQSVQIGRAFSMKAEVKCPKSVKI